MSNRKRRSYRGPDRTLSLPGVGNTQDVGFLQTAQGSLDKLKKRVAGLRDRLRYRYSDGVPAAYTGESLFRPEASSFEILVARIGDPFNGLNPSGIGGPTTAEVQYVVRDDRTHTIPVILPGPGVFMARYLHVEFYQRIYGGDNNQFGLQDLSHRVMRYCIPFGKSFFDPNGNGRLGQLPPNTGKVSLLRRLNACNLSWDRNQLGINFFWNLVDADSQRRVGDDLIPHDVLLPQGYQSQVSGDLFEFPVPWLFERGGRVDFQFRLINPILQLAASDPETPFLDSQNPFTAWDDREQDGTIRNQEVLVRVELHGTKFYSERDRLLREAI